MYDVVRLRSAALVACTLLVAACSPDSNAPTSVVPRDADDANLTVNKKEFVVAANAVKEEQPWSVATDGSKALVAYNDTTKKKTFQVVWGTQSFSYTLPPTSGATFTWTGSQSSSAPLDAKAQLQVSSFSSAAGLQTEATSAPTGGFNVGYADGGDYAVYQNVDFGASVRKVKIQVASAGSGGSIELRLDAVDGPLLGTVTVPVTGGWQTWKTVSAKVSGASGIHDLYLVFKGGQSIGNVNWLRFK